MKPFNLEEALNGKPVKLRNGMKALICYRIPDEYVFNDGSSAAFPLQGIIFNKRGNLKQIAEVWRDNGTYGDGYLHKFDIIGMWDKPKISIEDLPKPFKPKLNEYFYSIVTKTIFNTLNVMRRKYTDPSYDDETVNQGNAFRTEADAQKWLDFMESQIEE